MYLTEAEENEIKIELLYTILNDYIPENYDVSDDHVMTEEEAYMLSILTDYFLENYKEPTLKESSFETLSGQDINAALYEEIEQILMDESVGSFIAGARHGISTFISGKKAERATSQKNKAKANFDKYRSAPNSSVMKHDVLQKTQDKTKYDSSIKDTAKSAFHQAKINTIKARADKAKDVMKAAETKRKSQVGKYHANMDKKSQLANRIDTGIANIKNKVTSKIKSGAQKVAAVAGSVAGRLA